MDESDKISEWDKPLTKGQFYVFQLAFRRDFYLALLFFFGFLSCYLIVSAILNFFSSEIFSGIAKIIYLALVIIFAKG